MAKKFVDVAGPTVFLGDSIPAHDATHDLADSIGKQLDEFRNYVASVRDSEQAAAAVKELLQAFLVVAEQNEAEELEALRNARLFVSRYHDAKEQEQK